MMSRRLRLGLVALGVYLASIGSMLALDGWLSSWFRRDLDLSLRWLSSWFSRDPDLSLPMSAVVGVPAAVVGVCFVLAATLTAAAGRRERNRPFPARQRNAAPRRHGAEPRPPVSASAGERSARGDARVRPAAGSFPSPAGTHGRSGAVAGGLGPARAAAEAATGGDVPTGEPGNGNRSVSGRASFAGSPSDAERPASPVLDPNALEACWRRYRDEGDGHFRADGLRAELLKAGLPNDVIEGRDIGAGKHVLVVHTGSPGGRCYVVPSFVEAPTAVKAWFEDRGADMLSRRVNDIQELAVGKRKAYGVELVKKGAVS